MSLLKQNVLISLFAQRKEIPNQLRLPFINVFSTQNSQSECSIFYLLNNKEIKRKILPVFYFTKNFHTKEKGLCELSDCKIEGNRFGFTHNSKLISLQFCNINFV